MVRVAEGDPTMVVSTAAMGGGAAKGRMCFHAEVAFDVRACCFVVPSDLAVVTEGGFVASPCIIRWGKTEDELSIVVW